MKKFLSLLLATMLVFSVIACSPTNTASTSGGSTNNSDNAEVTDELLESYAASALLAALRDGHAIYKDGRKSSIELNYAISPEDCKMKVESINGNAATGWVVKGEVPLYDSSRDLCTTWSDGSGDYSMAFDVVIESDFSAECVFLD